jgi:hypothetical protein
MNKIIEEIFCNDPFELLIDDSKAKGNRVADKKLIDSFQEIVQFYEDFQREPNSDTTNILEFKLFARLQSIRKTPSKIKILKSYDFYSLLDDVQFESIDISDLIKDDPLGILEQDKEDIFKLMHVKKSDRIKPDFLSRRTICKNFEDYEFIFEQVYMDLESGQRRVEQFSSEMLVEGGLFVLNGVMLVIDKLNISQEEFGFNSGNRTRVDGRTRCVFDNGTESDMLFRSLEKALAKDGFSISQKIQRNKVPAIDEADVQNGYVYVLKSLSNSPNIASIENLYKIGCSKYDVFRRTKNASNEATYLMSEILIEDTYRCFNISPKKLEGKLLSFFNLVRLDIEIIDKNNNKARPREWFVVPKNVIEDAINLAINGDIDDYFYDHKNEIIVKKIDG